LHPPDGDADTYEWHEESSKQAQADAGMGSLSSTEQGVSYLGLSSGATFLNVIRRLSPKPLEEPSPLGQIMAAMNQTNSSWSVGQANGYNLQREASRGVPGKLASIPQLPPLMEVLPLVDSYFNYFRECLIEVHSSDVADHLTPVVHEPTIRAQIMGALPISSKPGSEVLLYMIFAMGALDRAKTEDDDDGFLYYDVARRALSRDMLEEGTLPLAQGLAVMANYLQRSNRPNAGYVCLGWAIRMATALGLHTPVTSWRCSPLEKEMRIRVWWAIVTLEAGCSVTFGRPHAIGSGLLSTVPLPINCEDEHLTVSSLATPTSVDSPTLYTALVVQARLARATCPVHDRILQAHPAPTVEQIKRYDERILAVINQLPPFMKVVSDQDGRCRLARSVQVWRARDFRAILYRPVLLAAAWDSSNRKELSSTVRQAIEYANLCPFVVMLIVQNVPCSRL
jgi:transcriptional regulatory protein GAL4